VVTPDTEWFKPSIKMGKNIILFSVMALNYHSFMSEKQPAKTHTNMLYLNKIHFHCAEKSSQNIQLNTEPFNFSVT